MAAVTTRSGTGATGLVGGVAVERGASRAGVRGGSSVVGCVDAGEDPSAVGAVGEAPSSHDPAIEPGGSRSVPKALGGEHAAAAVVASLDGGSPVTSPSGASPSSAIAS